MHLTSPVVHSSGRTVSLGLSGAVALFGHFGIEWDLTAVDDATREEISAWVALAKRLRPLDRDGPHRPRRRNGPGHRRARDGGRGCCIRRVHDHARPRPPSRTPPAECGCRAWLTTACTGSASSSSAMRANSGQSALAWTQHDTILTGRELEAVGLRPPVQLPQQATVVELTSVP